VRDVTLMAVLRCDAGSLPTTAWRSFQCSGTTRRHIICNRFPVRPATGGLLSGCKFERADRCYTEVRSTNGTQTPTRHAFKATFRKENTDQDRGNAMASTTCNI